MFRGQAVSDHPLFPYDQTMNSTLLIVETGSVQQASGFPTYTDFCRWKLRTLLGKADTLVISVDSAMPPPPLGTLVRVQLPDDVDAWYQLTGFNQALDAAFSSWTLQWWSNP